MGTRVRSAGVVLVVLALSIAAAGGRQASTTTAAQPLSPEMLIKHLVVIFQENRSFDHYFGVYPNAANLPGEPPFSARPGTPSVNGLTETLRTHNPNLVQPFRLSRTQSYSCDHSHEYAAEQRAYNRGLLDSFIQSIAIFPPYADNYCPKDAEGRDTIVMGHVDGNTVTALWHYAQYFAISDAFFGTTFGPSTVGAINLIAADTAGVICGPQKLSFEADVVYGDVPTCGEKGGRPADSTATPAASGPTTGTLVGDPDPLWDVCSTPDASLLAAFGGRNLGQMLTEAGVTWGWFHGGFALAHQDDCARTHTQEAWEQASGMQGSKALDYIPHHNPLAYFAATANPRHLPPTSTAMIGRTDQAMHQYDLSHFWQAAEAGNVPTVSFLRSPGYQDGHTGYSDPLDEQVFLVETLNRLQQLPEWGSMAVIIAYDDGGGWYDHVMPPIVNHSTTPLDWGCGERTTGAPARCGYGPRLPFLVISPYAKENYVSSQVIDQSSIARFIEDRWLGGERISPTSFDNFAGSLLDLFDFSRREPRVLLLDPRTGLPSPAPRRP